MYKTESEFLKHYDAKKYDQLSMTSDIMLLSISSEKQDNYRKINEKKLSILLVKRNDFPYKDKWCLPGGFLNPNTETLEDTARRILKEEVNLENIYMEQLCTYDDIGRDPRCRVVSTSFIALVDKSTIKSNISPNASWFNIEFLTDTNKAMKLRLSNGEIAFVIECKKHTDSSSLSTKYELTKNDFLAFDHPLIIFSGIERLRNKLEYTDLVFYMMPKYFTLGELQKVYETISNKKLLEPAFRRTIADKVKKSNKMQTGGGHRPSVLFTYNK